MIAISWLINIFAAILYSFPLETFFTYKLHLLEIGLNLNDKAKRFNGFLVFLFIVTGNQYKAKAEIWLSRIKNFLIFRNFWFLILIWPFVWKKAIIGILQNNLVFQYSGNDAKTIKKFDYN
jgi:hypothetical protein